MGDKARTPKVYRAPKPLTSSGVGALLVAGGFIALIAIKVNTELPAMMLILGMGALTAASYFRPWSLGPLRGMELTLSLAIVTFSSLGLIPIERMMKSIVDVEGERQHLRDLQVSNPSALPTALKTAYIGSVQQLADAGSAPARAELDRRGALVERQNAKEIARELAKIKEMPADDYVGLSQSYAKLAELAPSNASFAARANRASQDLADYKYKLDHPEVNIEVKRSSWSKGGFGSIYLLDITLSNKSRRPYKDFEITCTNQAPSGTMVVANKGTILEVLKGGETRRFRRVNLGFVDPAAASSACGVTAALPY